MGTADKYTRMMAEYSANLKYTDLPGEVVEQAKMLTMQTLGAAIGSYPTGQATRAIDMTKAKGGKAEASILVDGAKVPMEEAAFVNATMADILDWEDCSWTGHPSAGAIPTALAVAEGMKRSGKDYLTAVVDGYEVYQRIAMAVQPGDARREKTKSWGLVSWQIYAGLIPAAKLLGLDVSKTQQALGVGLYQVNVPAGQHAAPPTGKSDVYHYAHGFCARDGVVSALIAKSGIDGMYSSLDEPGSYAAQVTDDYKTDWYSEKGYLIMDTLYKHWPANMWIQGPLDALDAVVKENKIKAADIAEITMSPSYAMTNTFRPEGYVGMLDAQFSIPFCFGSLLVEPEPGANWWTEAKLKDPKVLAFAAKVKGLPPTTTPYESFKLFQDRSFPEVTITVILNNKQQFTKKLRFPKGHPKNRMTWDELKDRFRRATSFALSPAKIEKAIDGIVNLDRFDNMVEFAGLLRK